MFGMIFNTNSKISITLLFYMLSLFHCSRLSLLKIFTKNIFITNLNFLLKIVKIIFHKSPENTVL